MRSVKYLLLLFIVAGPLHAGTMEKIYEAEYSISKEGNISNLDVVFYVKTTPKQREEILSSEIENVLKIYSPKGNIMATAWDKNENILDLPNGMLRLIYSPKYKETRPMVFEDPFKE